MSIQYLEHFYTKFDTYLDYLPYHKYVSDSLFFGNFMELPNILLYGSKGFPSEYLIEYSISKLFKCEYPIQKRYPIWNQTLPYIESNYYFCIDSEHPEFPKDVDQLILFIKHIVSSKCIHMDRHIILLKNIDQITNRKTCYMFRVLLERFSQNVLFISTTHYIQLIENPLKSRMQLYRIPLPTYEQIHQIIKQIKPIDKELPKTRNLMVLLFHLDTLEFSTLNYPPIVEINEKKMTQVEIRRISYKLFQYQISVADLIHDCTCFISDKYKSLWIHETALIEHRHRISDPVKKCYYIELILNIFELYKQKIVMV
jgi:hypothetical protein